MAISVEEFDAFAKGLQLPNIHPWELRTKCDRRLNTLPPANLLPNIVETAWVVQLVRNTFDKPVVIHSTYRAIPYNRTKGSSDGSLHVQFNAIDFHVKDVSHSEVYGLLTRWRGVGVFRGGLGKYSWGVHVDTRGTNADW